MTTTQAQLAKQANPTTAPWWAAEEPAHNAAEKGWYWFGRGLVDVLAGLRLKLDVQRAAPLPKGAKIIAPNHPTTTDPAIVLKLVDEQASILISETLFKVPVLGHYLRRAGHVPVIRGSGQAALDEGLRLLKAGRTVIIFPEGAISPLEGGCHKPHSGVARLALASGAPVIPVGIGLDRARVRLVETEVDGVTEVGTWYLGGPYAMTAGEPLVFGGDVEDREHVRAVAEQVMGCIQQLARESSARLEAPAGHRSGFLRELVTRPVRVAQRAA